MPDDEAVEAEETAPVEPAEEESAPADEPAGTPVIEI